eukprot:7486785-Lingulodinium_polyedra.AAC.1
MVRVEPSASSVELLKSCATGASRAACLEQHRAAASGVAAAPDALQGARGAEAEGKQPVPVLRRGRQDGSDAGRAPGARASTKSRPP